MLAQKVLTLANKVNVPDEVLCDILKTNNLNIVKNNDIAYKQLETFTSYLHISFEDFINETYDIDLIKKRFYTPSTAIPDSYIKAAGSYPDALKSIIDHIAIHHGPRSKQRIFEKTQLNENILIRDDIMLNLNALLDITEYISEIKLSEEEIKDLAYYVNLNTARAAITQNIKNCRSHSEITKILISNASGFDKNFDYHFEALGDRYKVTGIGRENVHDELMKFDINNQFIHQFKTHVISTIPLLISNQSMKLIDRDMYTHKGRLVQEYVFKDKII